MNFEIVPYLYINGEWSLSDETMAHLWLLANEQGLIEKTFVSEQLTTLGQWFSIIQNRNNLISVVSETEENKPAAICWLNDFGRNHASGHFFMFREYWGKATIQIGKRVLKYWFEFERDGKPLLDIIIGRVPQSNQIAIKYVKKFGFWTCGVIPGIIYDAQNDIYQNLEILCMKREDFENG